MEFTRFRYNYCGLKLRFIIHNNWANSMSYFGYGNLHGEEAENSKLSED